MVKAPQPSGDTLVSAAEIARIVDVGRSTVTNWRRQNDDFPKPHSGTDARPLYKYGEIKDWIARYSLQIRGRQSRPNTTSEDTRPLSIRLTEEERSQIDAAALKHEVDTAPWARKHLLTLAKHGADGVFVPLTRIERAYMDLRSAEAEMDIDAWIRRALLGDMDQTLGGEKQRETVA
jgi:transposase-like protein